jgi:acetyl esterase
LSAGFPSTLDPELRSWFEAAQSVPPLDQLGVGGARQWAKARRVAEPAPFDGSIDEIVVQASEGIDRGADIGVPIRMYRPTLALGRWPVIVFIHGGGWILGDLDGVDYTCRSLARGSGCAVVSVGYRLAPEDPFPAAIDDCVAVVRWLLAHGSRFGLDASRLCVAGESSGGQLAAATCAVATVDGMAQVRLQLLVCPAIDRGMKSASWREFGDRFTPRASQMSWMWGLYAGPKAPAPDYRLHLEELADCSGLPEALIITAELDPLRDEGESWGRRLADAGVPVTVRRYEGQLHTVFAYAPFVAHCNEALDAAATFVKARLSAGEIPSA